MNTTAAAMGKTGRTYTSEEDKALALIQECGGFLALSEIPQDARIWKGLRLLTYRRIARFVGGEQPGYLVPRLEVV